MRRLVPPSSRFVVLVGLSALAAGSVAGCSKSKGGKSAATAPVATEAAVDADQAAPQSAPTQGTVFVSTGRLPLPKDGSNRLQLPTGDYIVLQTIHGESYVTIQATMDETSFKTALGNAQAKSLSNAELAARLRQPLEQATTKLAAQIGGFENLRLIPEVGFFSAQMKLARFDSLRQVTGLPSNFVLSPVVVSPMDDRFVQKMDAGLVEAVLADPRASTEAFSGLKRMGVPDFLATVSAELGTTPDGSRVKVGVTDTGVTLNQPTLQTKDGTPRAVYLKDFTGEGRIYFNPAATLEVAPGPSDATLLVKAQVLAPVTGAGAKPVADDFKAVSATLQVSPELRTLLLAANSGVKLGALSESSFTSADKTEKVDLNQNGKTDDELHALLVPTTGADGAVAYKVYFDTAGDYDFRKAKPIGNYNDAHDTIKLVAERFGFFIEATTLKDKQDADVHVIGASIVGFDPGNHGTHVSGIIAGRKTISNDSDATLARGAAPNASLMVDRVCANNGGCDATKAVIDLALNGAEVINMSLGGLSPFNDGYGVEEVMIDRLTEMRNVLFVISAGNSGPGINTVGSPSTARLALSVAATASGSLLRRQYQWPASGKVGLHLDDAAEKADDDFVLFFSSRGPTAAGGFKPNIAAPGTELSSVELNSAPGQRAGLDVYWGTSMAAPSATGAIALLLDAAKLHNALHPDAPLPIDSLTLRKVLIASARPFDTTRFDPATNELTRGQFSWIDEGAGMINLPRAWVALKVERDTRLPSAVFAVAADGTRTDIAVDYQIRTLRKSPTGLAYDGSAEIPASVLAVTGPRFGRGIWLDVKDSDSLVPVQIARRLPYSATQRVDAGDLKRLLVTSSDEFVIKTVMYGSNKVWISAGSLNQLDCAGSPTANLRVNGEGAIDNFDSTTDPRSTMTRDSTLFVCVDRAVLSGLPAGDHGALISLYRKVGDKVEANAEVVVPVYVTVPQKTLAGAAGYEVSGTVQAFGVARNYVDVPEGVSLVTVTLEVPAAKVEGSVTKDCSSVRLYAFEASNSSTPPELTKAPDAIANSCDDNGRAVDHRVVTFSRTNPKAGLWDLHLFGRYQFPSSEYKLTVQYAKVKTSLAQIVGGPEALDGTLDFTVVEASFASRPSAEKTTLTVNGLRQAVRPKVKKDEQLQVPTAEGGLYRAYGADTTAVTIATGGAPGNDVDLYVLECAAPATTVDACKPIGQSTTASDVETVTFTPDPAKLYTVVVIGYAVEHGDGSFDLVESQALKTVENATISVADIAGDAASFRIGYDFDQGASKLLHNPLYLTGLYSLSGDLTIRTATGATMVSLPVVVTKAALLP